MTQSYDYSQDIAPAGDNLLKSIGELALNQSKLEAKVTDAEAALKTAKENLHQVKARDLPELMREAGQTDCRTLNGLRVRVKDVLRASIPDDKKPEAFKVLKETGNESVIKQELKAQFDKGDEGIEQLVQFVTRFHDEIVTRGLDQMQIEARAKGMDWLVHRMLGVGVQAESKQSVHPQTLAALLREMLKAGKKVDLTIFGAIVQKEALVEVLGK